MYDLSRAKNPPNIIGPASQEEIFDMLDELNFSMLLHYGGKPPVQNKYKSSLKCCGYCVDCENKGFSEAYKLDQMSHGCSIREYETLLGPLPVLEQDWITKPVLFLLERPGGDYKNGEIVCYQSYNKCPPVNHYYWTPSIQLWPRNLSDIGDFYGNYFAYLMLKHKLSNVYITNTVKCHPKISNGIDQYCMNRWLSREVGIFLPEIVICFGQYAYDSVYAHFVDDSVRNWKFPFNSQRIYCSHPAQRTLTREAWVKINDEKIHDAIIR